jgi:hypothetical protein
MLTETEWPTLLGLLSIRKARIGSTAGDRLRLSALPAVATTLPNTAQTTRYPTLTPFALSPPLVVFPRR